MQIWACENKSDPGGSGLRPENMSEPWWDQGLDGGEGGRSAQHHQARSRGRTCLLTQQLTQRYPCTISLSVCTPFWRWLTFHSSLALPVVIGNGVHMALFDRTTAEWIRLLLSFVSAAQLDASAPLSSESCPPPSSPHCHHTVATPSPHCPHTVCTLSPHCCHTIPTPSPHRSRIVPTPSPHIRLWAFFAQTTSDD